ncbi:acyltransferase family protein [Acetobacter indonesiensis]|uniref:acyltransferase family protein n=1 Tax=Acetobacter indonesiensis TaxID=104101 RepID=UPI0020A4C91F|nr:acyltransferase [Acetobacter indonesiensis]MCP1232276.1 acyltransferase [Acetobacter indonesiensis]
MTNKFYRLDIDGLRAFAVLAVIINHANHNTLCSGFLGVDVFFVISGFVIMKSLLRQPMRSFISFLNGFYIRRFKRLFPALLIVIATTFFVLFYIDPNPYASINTGIFSLIGLSNIYLWRQSLDYFSADISFNAFMHTWSLGVEEQFYLIVPALMWLALQLHFMLSSEFMGNHDSGYDEWRCVC